jgi:hypothetical protein
MDAGDGPIFWSGELRSTFLATCKSPRFLRKGNQVFSIQVRQLLEGRISFLVNQLRGFREFLSDRLFGCSIAPRTQRDQ